MKIKQNTNSLPRTASSPRSVLVIGDIILDRYLKGSSTRYAPESCTKTNRPSPVLQLKTSKYELGGAANVASKLKELGCRPILLGMVGKDAAGHKVKLLLKKQGISTEKIIRTQSRPTTTKTRYIADEQMLLRVDKEKRSYISRELERRIIRVINEALQNNKVSTVVFSDYALGLLTPKIIKTTLEQLNRLPVIIDPKGKNWTHYKNISQNTAPFIITPNLKELRLLGSLVRSTNQDALTHLARKGLEITKASCLALTRGEAGISLYTKNRVSHFPAPKATQLDVTGAGDGVVASLASSLASAHKLSHKLGYNLNRAIKEANIAGATIVTQNGTGSLAPPNIPQKADGTITSSAATWLADITRQKSQRVVFTNGCFDILHPGHLHLLRAAREAGDILIVGLNSDKSVKALKGNTRPIQNKNTRAEMLLALPFVDAVVIFNSPTPIALIKKLRPDVLVKGGDYKNTKIVGADFVKSRGGKVIIIPNRGRLSSSSIINDILRRHA